MEEQALECPRYYGEDRIQLMVVSPYTLFAYWEVTWSRMRLVADYLQADYKDLQKGLRLYDVSETYFNGRNSHYYRDIFVHEEADDWNIYEFTQGRNYIVDYGVHHHWRFLPIIRSNVVHVPYKEKSKANGKSTLEDMKKIEQHSWAENFSAYSVYEK